MRWRFRRRCGGDRSLSLLDEWVRSVFASTRGRGWGCGAGMGVLGGIVGLAVVVVRGRGSRGRW